MYSLNGVKLLDSSRNWKVLREGTNTQAGFTKTLNKTPNPGRPGYTPAPSVQADGLVIFQMRIPKTGLDDLLMLCRAATTLTLDSDSTRAAAVETASAIPSSDTPWDLMQDVTVTLSLYEAVWRDVTPVTAGPTLITTPTQVFDMLSGISADVYDQSVFVRGAFGQFTLTDSGGSYLKTVRAWPGSSSTGILYVGSTGQAFLANESNPFVPVSDASQYVDVSGNGGFRLTPQMIAGNPSNRQVELTLTTLAQTASTTLRVQARRAYGMN